MPTKKEILKTCIQQKYKFIHMTIAFLLRISIFVAILRIHFQFLSRFSCFALRVSLASIVPLTRLRRLETSCASWLHRPISKMACSNEFLSCKIRCHHYHSLLTPLLRAFFFSLIQIDTLDFPKGIPFNGGLGFLTVNIGVTA